MTVSQSTVVQRVRYHLGDFPWETTGSASSSSSVVAVTDGDDWSEGDIGEFVNNGENFRVSSVSSNDLTAGRGFYGTTAATQSSGRVLKNPRFKYTEITNAISSVIQGQLNYPRVYKVSDSSVTPSWGFGWGSSPWGGGLFSGGLTSFGPWVDLDDANALGLIAVSQLTDADPPARVQYGQRHGSFRVLFARNLPVTLAASTVGIAFPDGFADEDNTVFVTYASKITDTVDTGAYTDFSDGDAVTEAIILGAVAQLQGALEIRKPDRALNEVDRLRSSSYYFQLFRRTLSVAEQELRAKAPLMVF